MTRLFLLLLTLLFSLSGPAMGANSDFRHFGIAAKGTPALKYHYTTAPESSFGKGLWRDSSVTDKLYTDAVGC